MAAAAPPTRRHHAVFAALRQLARDGDRAHDARARRLVAAFRLAGRRRDRLPAHPFPLADLRLDVLTYRWGRGPDGRRRPRLPLATYRPVFDLRGSGRVRFAIEDARDAARPGTLGDRHAAHAALALHHAAEQAAPESWIDALPLPRLLLAYDPALAPGPTPGLDPEGWDALARDVEGLRAWPQDLLARPEGDADERPLDPAPRAAYAVADGLRGVRGPNPVFPLLRARGLVPDRATYRDWARAVAPPGDAPAPPEGSTAARLLDDLAAHLGDAPGREDDLRAELAALCLASGHPLRGGAGGPEADALLAAPWADRERPDAPRPLLVRLDGHPGPDTARFASPFVAADLDELGPSQGGGIAAHLDGRGARRR